jgi:putative membrane-bound dehydrogenase-like protein
MKKCLFLFVLTLPLALPAAGPAQVPPEKALSTFSVSDGLEISLWASEPLFANPTCMDIDHKGRVWVCESVNYRTKLHKKPFNREEGDRIVILEDTTGSGKADKATTFYQSPELYGPLGIAVAKDPAGPGYKVYVAQSPDILVFADKDGDGKADGPPKKLLTGFGGFDHDHGVHGLLFGPDGKLYFSVGDQGVHGLQSSDGKGRKWSSNDTDCRAGTIWRCELDGTNLELIAHNFRNEYEPCVDSFGTVFVSDNDDDGNQQTRICYVMPGGNYGYHPRGPGQSHWHEEQPGVVPKILRTYFGSPTGMCVYEGTLLPKKYQGQLLHTDAGPRHVRCYHLKENGAGYDVDREDMVTSTDNWFRPSDVCVAPDGSVFVADWYDPGVGGHGMGDTTRGRIFRVAPKGNKPSVPAVDLETKDGILSALASPNLAVRYMALAKLMSMDQKEATDLMEAAAVQKENPWLRARALWQLGRRGRLRFLATDFEDRDPRFRLLAIRILKDYQGHNAGDYMPDWRKAVLEDSSAAIRREALLTLRDAKMDKAKELIVELAQSYDGKDRYYLEAIGIAVGHHDKARRDVLLADFEKEFPDWNDKVLDLVWELRPPQVLPRLEALVADAKASTAARGRAIDILAASDDASAGKVMLKLLSSDLPPEVRGRVIDNLKQFLPSKWRDLRGGNEVKDAITSLIQARKDDATALALIAAAERTDSALCTQGFALDRQKPTAFRKEAIATLGKLPSKDAVVMLYGLLNANEEALAPDVVAALGAQVTGKGDSPASKLALEQLQALLSDKKSSAEVRSAALAALAGSRPGTVWLLDKHASKELPEALLADAGRLLRNSPHQDLRNKAMIAFPPPGKLDPKKLPSIPALLTRKGNADHGKQLLAASLKNDMACLKCHTVRGFGGAIGPDLSVIGKKASRDNLFESILYPSKAIADQFLTWQIETTKGLALLGLIVEETADHVTLRDANGKDTKIDKKDIDTRTKSPNSLMPSDLLVYMTEDELVDIVEYLFSLKTPALTFDSWRIAGAFDNGVDDAGLDRVFPPEKAIDLQASYPGKSGPVRWRTVKPNNQGYVDLLAFLGNESVNAVSYLHGEVESPADQEALVLLGTDDGAKLWVRDELVYTNRAHRAAVPEQDSVKVQLKKGRNKVLLKINNGAGDHGFYFTLLAEQELKRVEEK